MGSRPLDLIRNPGQGFGSVDDHLELVAGAGRGVALGPTAWRRVEGS